MNTSGGVATPAPRFQRASASKPINFPLAKSMRGWKYGTISSLRTAVRKACSMLARSVANSIMAASKSLNVFRPELLAK
jgi:hypothetical protein